MTVKGLEQLRGAPRVRNRQAVTTRNPGQGHNRLQESGDVDREMTSSSKNQRILLRNYRARAEKRRADHFAAESSISRFNESRLSSISLPTHREKRWQNDSGPRRP